MNVVTEGKVVVEQEGISLTYPCRPLLIATFNPDKGEVRDHLLDRINCRGAKQKMCCTRW